MHNLILIGIIVACILGGIFLIDRNGYNRCEIDYINAAAEFDDDTDVVAENERTVSETRIREVYNAPPSDDGLVAPVLERVIDGLQARHDTAQ